MQHLFLNKTVILGFTIAECIHYVYKSAIIALFCLSGVFLYIRCRPFAPARVNCWFCNKSLWVPYSDRNCFDCPHCDQYNGFTKDGDYNTDVLHRKRKVVTYSPAIKKDAKRVTNGLCKSCNVNQQLKVQQLSTFVPMIEENFDAEIKHFKEQLEKSYRLCDRCSLVLTQTLQTQHYELLTQRLNGHCQAGKELGAHNDNRFVRFLHIASACCLSWIFACSAAALAIDFGLDGDFIHSAMYSDFDRLWIFRTAPLSALGVTLNLGLLGINRRIRHRDGLCLVTWSLVHALAWTECPSLFLLLSLIPGIFLHFVSEKHIFKKPSVNPQVTFTTIQKSTPLSEVVKSSIVETAKNSELNSQPIEKQSEKIVNPETSKDECRRIQTRSRSLKKQNVSDLDLELKNVAKTTMEPRVERSRHFSPPPEVYKGFSSLRLASPEPLQSRKTPEKPANYLFEKLNFCEKKTKPDLIKPAKLTLKQKSSSTISDLVHERVESPCPSSSPTFHDSCPDVNITALSPFAPLSGKYASPSPYHVEYDYGSYSPYPGCMASLPVGHTTVYTYSRPSTYPFNFSPPRFSPPFPVPYESPFSSKSSDSCSVIHNGNLSSFSSIQGLDKWLWLKRTMYVFSLVLNIATLICLIYNIWKN